MAFPLRIRKKEEGDSHSQSSFSTAVGDNIFTQPLPEPPTEEEADGTSQRLFYVDEEFSSNPYTVAEGKEEEEEDDGGELFSTPHFARAPNRLPDLQAEPTNKGSSAQQQFRQNNFRPSAATTAPAPELHEDEDDQSTFVCMENIPAHTVPGSYFTAAPRRTTSSGTPQMLLSADEGDHDTEDTDEDEDGSRTTEENSGGGCIPHLDYDGNAIPSERKKAANKLSRKRRIRRQLEYMSYMPKAQYDISDIPMYTVNGRAENLRRLIDKEAPPYVIPHYEQACFKYIFSDAFDEGLDGAELQALVGLVLSSLINCSVVTLNVFGDNDDTASTVVSTQAMTQVVFIMEFVVVIGILFVSMATIVEGFVRRNVSTDTAIDFVELSMLVGSFSTFQVVNLVSPNVVINRIMPEFTTARTLYDHIKAVVTAGIWLILCVLACLAVVLKVSQVGFVSTVPIDTWSSTQLLKMLGLVLNLAKVDQSYEAELSTCLKALHQHYAGPGGPDSMNARSEGFYSQVLQFLGVNRKNSYEYFEAVFNHHFGDGDPEDLTLRQSIRKALNFGAFIAQLNPRLLCKYLQMTRSPLPHYVLQRREFTERRLEGINESVVEADKRGRGGERQGRTDGPLSTATARTSGCVKHPTPTTHTAPNLPGNQLELVVDALETAIKQADPEADDILDQGLSDPKLFRLTFLCEDEDEDYTAQGHIFDLGVEGLGGASMPNPTNSHASSEMPTPKIVGSSFSLPSLTRGAAGSNGGGRSSSSSPHHLLGVPGANLATQHNLAQLQGVAYGSED